MIETSLSDMFGATDSPVIEDEQVVERKKTDIFKYISDICFFKKGTIPEESDYEMKGWNTFMILKYLSLEDNYISIINILNEYQSTMTPKQMYKLLILVIPKRKKYLKYPKLQEQIYKDEDIKILQTYFDCSRADAMDYLNFGFISDFEIKKIKEKFGGKEGGKVKKNK